MLISFFRFTSWFDTDCNIVTHWKNFRKTSCMNIDYNYLTTIFKSIFSQMYEFLVKNIYLRILHMNFVRSKWKFVNNTRNTYIWVKILIKCCIQMIAAHANGFLLSSPNASQYCKRYQTRK